MTAAFIQHADSAAEKVSWVTKVKQQMAAFADDAVAKVAAIDAIAGKTVQDATPFQREDRVFSPSSAKGGLPMNTAKTVRAPSLNSDRP